MTSFFRVAIARIRVFRCKSALAGELKTNVDLNISQVIEQQLSHKAHQHSNKSNNYRHVSICTQALDMKL